MPTKSLSDDRKQISVWEQLATDQSDPWEVVPRQVFASYNHMSHLVGKPTMWFPNRSDTNRAVQAQKTARSLKFWSKVEKELYYLSSENKGADQLRGYREANLRLCFCLCRLLVFPWGGQILISSVLAVLLQVACLIYTLYSCRRATYQKFKIMSATVTPSKRSNEPPRGKTNNVVSEQV